MNEADPTAAGAAPPPPADDDDPNAARKGNFAKAREKLAEKRAAAKAAKAGTPEQPRPEKKPETPAVSDSSLRDGARIFVRVCWALTKLCARFTGRQLDSLADEEVSEGAEEALPLLRRFSLLASLLTFLGFPFFILRKVEEKLKPKVPKAALPGQAAPPSNVHPISATSGSP